MATSSFSSPARQILWQRAFATLLAVVIPAAAGAQAGGLCLSSVTRQKYTYNKVLSLSDDVSVEGFSMNDFGDVAIIATVFDGTNTGKCLLRGRRGSSQTILCDQNLDSGSAFQSLWGRPSINDNGAIVFSVVQSSTGRVFVAEPDAEGGGYALFRVADAPVFNHSRPVINNLGQVAFRINDMIWRWDPGNPATFTLMVGAQDLSQVQAFGIESSGDVTAAGSFTNGDIGAVLSQVPFGGGTPSVSSAIHSPDFPQLVGSGGEVLGVDFADDSLYYHGSYNAPGSIVNVVDPAMPPGMALGFVAVKSCNVAFSGGTFVGMCRGGSNDRGFCSTSLDCPGSGGCDTRCGVCEGGNNPCSEGCGDAFCDSFADLGIYLTRGATPVPIIAGVEPVSVSDIGQAGCVLAVGTGPVEVDGGGDIVHTLGLNDTGESFLVFGNAPGSSGNPALPSSCQSLQCRFAMRPSARNVGPGGAPYYFDPDVAIGYDYVLESGPNFASVSVPEQLPLGDNTFLLEVGQASFELLAGEQFDFTAIDDMGISEFTIRDIDPAEALDPDDPLAFVTGVTFVAQAEAEVTMTAIVPEPSETVLAAAALSALLGLRRIGRRRRGVRSAHGRLRATICTGS